MPWVFYTLYGYSFVVRDLHGYIFEGRGLDGVFFPGLYVIIVFTALSTSLILSYPRKKDSEHAGPANLASLGG
jgi:hypothetical protein